MHTIRIFFLFVMGIIMQHNYAAAQQLDRTLLIFGKEAAPGTVEQQLLLFQKDTAGMKERDLKIQVIDTGNSLIKKYKVLENQFTVLLLGKDGGEKLRTLQLLSTANLFSIIDAMPMRRQEMRKNHQP